MEGGMARILNVFLALSTLTLAGLWYGDRQRFPVSYVVCNANFGACSVAARFDDMTGCKQAEERGNWYCNSTDPRNIVCQAEKSTISATYCAE